MENLPTISDAEFIVMKIIWSNAPISTNEVIKMLAETTNWNPRTIQTLLSRLVKKGVLDYKKEGRVFIYGPLVKEEDYLEQESDTFLKRFYDGTLQSMVVNFLKQDKLTKDDINELKKILNERQAKGGK